MFVIAHKEKDFILITDVATVPAIRDNRTSLSIANVTISIAGGTRNSIIFPIYLKDDVYACILQIIVCYYSNYFQI